MNAKTAPWLLCLCLLLIQSLSSSSIPAQTVDANQTKASETAPEMAPGTVPEAPPQMTPEMRAAVEMDWDREAQRLGRDLSSFEEIASLFTRAQQTVDSWKTLPEAWPRQDVTAELARLETLRQDFDSMRKAPDTTAEQRLALYRKVRHCVRRIALAHPALAQRKIAFMKQRRAIQQMFHEYSGYYYNLFNIHGGGVFVLEKPGLSLETTELTAGKLPRGTFTSPSLSLDGKTIYFAFSRVMEGERPWTEGRLVQNQLPDPPESAPFRYSYFSTTRCSFHLFAMDVDGSNLRQLTQGIYDDTDPCELPNGRIAFMSTRRGGYIRCNSSFEPIETSTLHCINKDGSGLTQLSWHETDEWGPSLMPDGRILYTRWDYVDRDATLFHGLWTSNPDGTAPTHLFGSYTTKINAHYQGRAIPGTKKIVCLAGAHHAVVGGSLIVLDTEKLDRDPETGEDSLDAVEVLTPEIGFSEVGGHWAKSFYHSPVPLSENHFLVAFSFDPLPGMGSGWREDSPCGIYYFDRFGNKELLYRDVEISSVGPMLLNDAEGRTLFPAPPTVASGLNEELAAQGLGEFLLTDVYQSQLPFPEGRKIKALRVYQLLPKTETCCGNVPRLGHAYTEPARAWLGDVPVEEDGSAWFRVPARRPLYFQAIDEEGRAVQTMRSNAYLQPGETRACVGCHEPVGQSPEMRQPPLASLRGPSAPTSGALQNGPMSFPGMVQPILDRHCVSCHDGTEKSAKPDLRGVEDGDFSRAYEELKPYLRWYEWGRYSISLINSHPGECGADASELSRILKNPTHAKLLEGDNTAYRQLLMWMDGNVPFYGSFQPGERARQKRGEPIAMPDFQ